ncbi:MAG: 50S ribosomal protein L21, partial [Actinobacteria bacterium]|nr:50S ribosomal protein L21 [Actinomycetota bacterium]
KIYAIITSGGRQYKIEENTNIVIDRIDGIEGDKVKITDVNFLSDGDRVEIGKPVLDYVEVEGTIKKQFRGDKVIAYKYKAKKRYHRKVGHRQNLTLLSLEKITVKKQIKG